MKNTTLLLGAGAAALIFWQLKKRQDEKLLEERMGAASNIDPLDPRQDLDSWIDSFGGGDGPDNIDIFGI